VVEIAKPSSENGKERLASISNATKLLETLKEIGRQPDLANALDNVVKENREKLTLG